MHDLAARSAIVLTVLLWVSGIHAQRIDLVTAPLSETELWLPSTRLLDRVAPSPSGEGQWYVALESGLALYDATTATAEIYRLPEYSSIRSITPVREKIWVTTQRAGIYVFDPGRSAFVSTIERGQGPEGTNLRLWRDPFSEDLWISRFHGLDRLDASSGEWHDLSGIFGAAGLVSSRAVVLPDERYVWVNSVGHRSGLLRFDRDGEVWRLYQDELVAPEMRDRGLGLITDVLVGKRHMWVVASAGNLYNFCIAVFDKPTGSWRPYCRAGVVRAIDLLIDALPEVRWIGRSNLLGTMKRLSKGAGELSGDHPNRFLPDEVRALVSATMRLEQAFREHGLQDVSDHGYARFALHEGAILDSGTIGLKPVEVARVHLPDIDFNKLVAIDAKGRIIAIADDSLVRIDPEGWRLHYFDAPAVSTAWSNRVVTLEGGRSVVVVSAEPGCDGPPHTGIALLTTDTLEGRAIEPASPGASHVGRVGARLAVRIHAGDEVLIYHVEADSWEPLAGDTDEPFVEGTDFPESLNLPNGGTVRLAPDGLVVTVGSSTRNRRQLKEARERPPSP